MLWIGKYLFLFSFIPPSTPFSLGMVKEVDNFGGHILGSNCPFTETWLSTYLYLKLL